MNEVLFLAVEEAIPADHPVAALAIPLGLLFFSGSVYLLLWSNYGARKAAAIYGTAFFGFSFILGLFWWLGGPGIPTGLGITHLPGQTNDHYRERWYAFEPGSERAGFFPAVNNPDDFIPLEEFAGVDHMGEMEMLADPMFASLSGSVSQAVDRMNGQFLPIDENGVAQIGVQRRSAYEEDARTGQPEGSRRATPFFTSEAVEDPRLIVDDATGVRLVTTEFQAYAMFVDDEGIPFDPVPVGEPTRWFGFFDPGAVWFPPALWTGIAFGLFLLSLFWLDRLEQREKRLRSDEVEEPEDLKVPIAQ